MDQRALERYFSQLDRSFFIDGPARSLADVDSALPIGFGQTISQPSLVLTMTRLLSPEKESKVLEIGTGSGYQTALLAAFSGTVYTMERIEALSEAARKRLDTLGFDNIHFSCADGSAGWPEAAPFDRIMVTAAAGRLPDPLVEQLAIGGRMIIPVGPPGMQELLLIKRDRKGRIKQENIEYVVFVELRGDYGWNRPE